MVAVAVMALVTSQLLESFSRQHTSSVAQERVVETQEEVRIVTDLIISDLRMAGFMVPEFAAVGSLDGGVNASDTLCVSDPSTINDTVLAGASSRFEGAPLVTAFTGATSSVTVSAADWDVDSDGDDDFVVGEGIIIATGSRSHCAVVTGLSGSTIDFTPATVAAFSATTDDVVVPAIVYSVAGTTLTRNSTVLSNQVEDLQVQFGVDIDSNGTVEGAEFPIDDMTGQNFELLENVRVFVTARDLRATGNFAGQFPIVANRTTVMAADNFKRRRATGDALLRNLQ
jgi:Tfp pilus assembly protein PilW